MRLSGEHENEVAGNHEKGPVGQIHDVGHAKNERETDSDQGVNGGPDQSENDDVNHHEIAHSPFSFIHSSKED